MNNNDVDKLVRSYRLTVIVMGLIIVTCSVLSFYIWLVYVPDIQYEVTKQALSDFVDEQAEVITE